MRWRQRGADGFCSQRFGDNTVRPSLSDNVCLFYVFYRCLVVYLSHLILLSPRRGHYLTCVMKKRVSRFCTRVLVQAFALNCSVVCTESINGYLAGFRGRTLISLRIPFTRRQSRL